MAELGQRGDGDAAFIVDADVFQCVGEDSILARIMIAARGVGMRLRAVEQVIGLTEIFGQQLQTGEHLLHICGGRADDAAVETLRRVRIKRRLLPAIFFVLLLCGGPLRPAKFGKSRKCAPISGHIFGKTEKKENRNKISFHPPRHVIYSEYQEKKGGSRD